MMVEALSLGAVKSQARVAKSPMFLGSEYAIVGRLRFNSLRNRE